MRSVIGQCHRRHCTKELRKFPQTLQANAPADLQLHLVLNNYRTHKTPAVRRSLASHPRGRYSVLRRQPSIVRKRYFTGGAEDLLMDGA